MKLFIVDCKTPFGGDGVQDVFINQLDAERCVNRLINEEQGIDAWIDERHVCICDPTCGSGCEACCGPDITTPLRSKLK